MAENGKREYAVRVRVDAQELEFLKKVAAAEERPVSWVLRRALREFYERRAEGQAA